ncbi:MAG: DsbE family thiol:disulfide interchange protein [Cellulomonas sp.]|nr:DsbE family thiol:disulfide interchange protein [Rickettsiella sp.]
MQLKCLPYLLLITLVLLLFFLWQGLMKDPMQIPSPLIDKAIPKFVAMSLEQKRPLTEKIFLGHSSLLVVWSSWCKSCLAENAFLLHLKKNISIQIIGLNYRDKLNAAKLWLNHYGNPYKEIIVDPKGSLGIDLGVYGVPESFLIDANGIIRYKHIGPLTSSNWISKIMPFIEKQYKK